MKKALLLGVMSLFAVPAAHAALITGVSATASSALVNPGVGFDRAASHTVDGSGQNADGTTSTNPDGTMWLDTGNGAYGGSNDAAPQITFNLGAAYNLTGMTVFNYNEGGGLQDRGIASALLSTSMDGINFTILGPLSFNEAPGTTSAIGQNINLSLTAKYIKLSSFTQFAGDDNNVQGLSEVTFTGALPAVTAVPEPASLALLSLGVVGLLAARKRARS